MSTDWLIYLAGFFAVLLIFRSLIVWRKYFKTRKATGSGRFEKTTFDVALVLLCSASGLAYLLLEYLRSG